MVRQMLGFDFTEISGLPLARRVTFESEVFDLSLERAMQDDLDMTNARGVEFALFVNLEATLRIGDAVIASLALETREPRFFFMGFDSTEERLQGQFYSFRDVLQDLGMNRSKRGTFNFQEGDAFLRLIPGHIFLPLLPGILAIGQGVIIQPTALFKRLLKSSDLFLGWIEPIL